jgi:hypothetical protein
MFFDMNRVPWLSKNTICEHADALLFDYEVTQEIPVEPPIPVENIIESHLGFILEFEDLQGILGFDDILGATWLNQKRIAIHEKLLEENLGRMFFTCGHEIGHVLLHSPYVSETEDDTSQPYQEQKIVCRATATKNRGEWQADYFAACLLMPEERVRKAYDHVFGTAPLIIHNKKSCFDRNLPLFDPAWDRANDFALMVIGAGNFTNVSKEAMRVRLEDLGLLVNNTQNQLTV